MVFIRKEDFSKFKKEKNISEKVSSFSK